MGNSICKGSRSGRSIYAVRIIVMSLYNIPITALFESSSLSEANITKRMVQRGQLSNTSMNRLKSAGMIKPKSQYMAGFDKGTENILKRQGASHHTSKIAKLGGGGIAFNPNQTKSINSIKSQSGIKGSLARGAANVAKKVGYGLPENPGKQAIVTHGPTLQKAFKAGDTDTTHSIVKRHEADELRAGQRKANILRRKDINYLNRKAAADEKDGGEPSFYRDIAKDLEAKPAENAPAMAFVNKARGRKAEIPKVVQKMKKIPGLKTIGSRAEDVIRTQKQVVGQHESPRVLKKEKEETDYINRAYGGAEGIASHRRDTGEAAAATRSVSSMRRDEKRGIKFIGKDEFKKGQGVTQKQKAAADSHIEGLINKWKSQGLSSSQIKDKLRSSGSGRQALLVRAKAKRYGIREPKRASQFTPEIRQARIDAKKGKQRLSSMSPEEIRDEK